MALQFTTSYLEDSIGLLGQYKKLADGAIGQVGDVELVSSLDREMNSIAQVMQHMAGNMKSRWTDFLTSDGEKPERDRDAEFEERSASRQELLALWESGWQCLFQALEPLVEADLGRTITIRGQAHSGVRAYNRTGAHIG